MKVKSGHKYRIYPTADQQESLAVQFGIVRFAYNKILSYRKKGYEQFGRSISHHQSVTFLARLKRMEKYEWMKKADSQALQQAIIDLRKAFDNFFAGRASYPKFKSKYHNQSYRYPQRFKLDGNKIYLPKVGWVKIVLHRTIKGKMKSCTVSRTKTGNYFVSILCEHDVEQNATADRVGIDVGLSHFATLSTGEKVDNPRHLRSSERRLKIRQRRLSRKQKGSNNRNKARHRVALVHEKVANQRKDFHHKLSRQLVDRYGCIAVEDLNIKGMVKNHSLAKSISDAGWSQFVQFCQYKQKWNGGEIAKVDRFYPSSKTCSHCGEVNNTLKLSDRVWRCPSCHHTHDRDENAANNILNEATVGHTESYACGNMNGVQSHGQHGFSRSAQEAHPL
jgi:putative transposase